MARKQWVRTRQGVKPPDAEKAAITAACERLIAEVLIPRFLPEIRPTEFNYPVAIHGKWLGGNYRFIQRFRSDRGDAIDAEFDAPFARIEYVSRDHFDVSYFRHTEVWFRLYTFISLREALLAIEENGILHPVV